jgi:Prolyl oligopeptidase family
MLDFASPWFASPHPINGKTFFNRPILPDSIVTSHLATLVPGESIVTAVDPPARLDIAIAIGHHGRFREFLGGEEALYPLDVIEKKAAREEGGEKFPPLFIFHGREDDVVLVEGTEKFVKVLEKAAPGGKVLLKLQSGGHGFDKATHLEEGWLREGLAFVERVWLV